MEALVRHAWPGNVRELRAVVRRAAWQARGAKIEPEHLPPLSGRIRAKISKGTLVEQIAKAARTAIEAALEATGGNRAKAARELGIHRTALYKKMGKLGIERKS